MVFERGHHRVVQADRSRDRTGADHAYFGSHAYGRAGTDSDVDLLVVTALRTRWLPQGGENCGQNNAESALICWFEHPPHCRKRLAMNDFSIKEIVEKGIVLHDATDARMGQKGRKRLQQRERLSRARTKPDFDGACFHAQQCAGKYMKAQLRNPKSVSKNSRFGGFTSARATIG